MRSSSQRERKIRYFTYPPLFIFIVTGVIFLFLGISFYNHMRTGERRAVENTLASYGNSLSVALRQIQKLTDGLSAFAKTYPEPAELRDEFPEFADGLFSSTDGITAIQVISSNSLSLVFPEAGNESLAGITLEQYLNDTDSGMQAEIQRAIQSRRTILSGPLELPQGGQVLVAQQAVYQGDTLWGFAIIRADWLKILADSGLSDQNPILKFALSKANGSLIFGEAGILLDSPSIYPIALQDGDWNLAAIPREGWTASFRQLWVVFLVSTGIILLVIAFLASHLSLNQKQLKANTEALVAKFDNELEANRQMQNQILKVNRVYTILSNVNEAIVRTQDLTHLFEQACQIAVKEGGYDLAWIGLLSPVTQVLRPVATAGRSDGYVENINLSLDAPPVPDCPIDCVLRGVNYAVRAFSEETGASQDPCAQKAAGHGFASMASFPLKVGGKIRGAFNLYANTSDYFNETELRLLEKLALDLSYAMDSIEKEEKRRWAENESLQIYRLYQVLSQVNQLVLRAASAEELFEKICQIAVNTGGFQLAWVGWMDSARQALQLVACEGDEDGILEGFSVAMDDPLGHSGPMISAIRIGEAFISVDFTNTIWAEIAAKIGFEAMGSFPIRVNGSVEGVLNIHVAERDYFRMKEINLLQEVADDISFALDYLEQEKKRQRAEQEVRENFQLLTALINSPIDMTVFSLDDHLRYTAFNETHRREMKKNWGVDIRIGQCILDLIPSEHVRSALIQSSRRALAGESFTETQHETDSSIYSEYKWNPILSPDGKVTGLTVFVQDITERKRSAEIIEASERRYRLSQKAAHIGSWEWEIPTDRLTWSDEMYRIFDKDPDQFNPTNPAVLDCILDEDRPGAITAVNAALTQGLPFFTQYRIFDRDGRIKWVESQGEVIFDEQGKAERAAGTVQDITERKRAEEETTLLNQQLFLLNSAVQELAAARSLESVMATVRTYARRLVKSDGSTFILQEGNQVYYADEDAIQPLWKGHRFPISGCISGWVILNKQPAVIDDVFLDDRIPTELYRNTFVKSLAMVPIRSSDPLGAIGCYWKEPTRPSYREIQLLQTLADATARAVENARLLESLEQRVAERTAQLELSNKELESFAYSVSHDLRAPLRAIDGYSRILQQEHAHKLDTEGLRLLDVVRKSTRTMDQLITDLLALSRVSRSEVRYSRIDMVSLVTSIYDELAVPEVKENFELEIADLPPAVGDPTLIRQVWMNLISNAIKYTMPKVNGRIKINGWEENGNCYYSVEDNGVGFDPRYAGKLFGLFQRLHSANEFEGTGVGLAIVQRVVNRHGGQVWGKGQVDMGATFTFSLPIREVSNG